MNNVRQTIQAIRELMDEKLWPALYNDTDPVQGELREALMALYHSPMWEKAYSLSNPARIGGRLNPDFTFENFVGGKSNQLALDCARQVAANPGRSYNPLFIYGPAGLGKTHLMHAVANVIRSAGARVAYVRSERFVSDMGKALRHNAINEFKMAYRTLDVLLIDDIQFLAGSDCSQEEFFHTFNALLEGQRQVILTCDRYPEEIDGLDEQLKSRFDWGLTVAIEPPELETCVAILMSKAAAAKVKLPQEVALFIAERDGSNVREMEGALRRVAANSQFTGRPITLDFAREALCVLEGCRSGDAEAPVSDAICPRCGVGEQSTHHPLCEARDGTPTTLDDESVRAAIAELTAQGLVCMPTEFFAKYEGGAIQERDATPRPLDE